jgi:hypothetical protein
MADPVSVIAAVISIASAIKGWIDDTTTKDETIIQIQETVSRVSNILNHLSVSKPLKDDKLLDPELLCLGSILTKTFEHIRVWQPKRLNFKKVVALVRPTSVTAVLRADERNISQQIIMVLFAMSTTTFLGSKQSDDRDGKPNALKWIRNPEVADFWEKQVGVEVQPSRKT